MNAREIVDYFRLNQVALEVVDGKIRFAAPQGFSTPELVERLRHHKAEIVELLDAAQQAPAGFARRPADAAPLLSYGQQRLWFLSQMDDDNAYYNVPFSIRATGTLDISALASAFERVVARHDILRTGIVVDGNVPIQVVAERSVLDLRVDDLTGLEAGEQDAAVQEIEQAEALTLFDLAGPSLLRVRVLTLAPDRHRILLTLHHIVSDARSIGILVRELSFFYTARIDSSAAELPLPKVQYGDYAYWQRHLFDAGKLEAKTAHLKRRLSGAPALLTLPTDRPRPPIQRHRGAAVHFGLPVTLAARMNELGRQCQATPFMTLSALFALFLSRYSGQDDICIGTPASSRNQAELHDTIGFFVNVVVLRISPASQLGFRAFLRQVRDIALDAYAHQDVPFERLVEELQPQRSLSHTPLFQAMLAWQDVTSKARLTLPGLELELAATEERAALCDLTLNVAEIDGRMMAR
ncbi:condensation domain-containing protein, partial [Caballeronia sp. dw_276]|uniref:condensation domain-containing protein n=1 Tax=Caballeronia sp. dw_276 TaxID=2719795 RepID=UPI002105B1A5